MPIKQLPSGRWQLDFRVGGRGSPRIVKSFDRKKDAEAFYIAARREKQLGRFYEPEDVTLAEFFETYWRFHALPNLADDTRVAYKSAWANHLLPRLGDHGLRQITPGVVSELPSQLQHAGAGAAVTKKAFAVLQSVLAYAVVRGRIEYNAAKAVRSPRYDREREPHVFLPAEVEAIRAALDPPSATVVSLLAYSGPRPEEMLRLRMRDIGGEAIFYDGRKTRRNRWTPLLGMLARDLREHGLALGRPGPNRPVIPAHDGGHWQPDDWRNWRRRVWRSWLGGDPKCKHAGEARCESCGARRLTPAGTRPRDLRASYVTVQVYAGVPLTTIARWCGTSVAMLDKHYAGVIANWDGEQVPADGQIQRARGAQRERRGH